MKYTKHKKHKKHIVLKHTKKAKQSPKTAAHGRAVWSYYTEVRLFWLYIAAVVVPYVRTRCKIR